MSDDVLFKNPYRGRRVAHPEPYQPEHERLGAQPVEYPMDKAEAHSFVEKNTKHEIPKQTIVQSGNNEDIMWTKALEEPETPRPPTVVPQTGQEIEDDIGLDKEEEGFGLDSLQPGNCVLLYNDNVICAGTIEIIKETLADLLADAENDVEVDNFIVLKRLKVNVGIFIDE